MRARAARMTIAAAMLGAVVAASPAQAAQIRVDRACYPGTGLIPVKVTGEGYTPSTQFLVLVNGGIVDQGTSDASGSIKYEWVAPAPPEVGTGAHDAGYHMEIKEGSISASTDFRAARVFGDYNPGNGNPSTLRVRFSAFGFGVETPPGGKAPEVFVHYVDPKGKLKKTISLGRGTGACGSIRRTAKRKLFPFAPRSGKWSLQFDTQRRYVKGTPRSKFAWDRLTLTIA